MSLGRAMWATTYARAGMDGHVGVESIPGRGSLFWFTLPFAEERVDGIAAVPAQNA